MHVQLPRKVFYDALQITQHGLPERTTLSALYGVLMEAREGQLHLHTTDLEKNVTAVVPAEVTTPGRLCVHGLTLNQIVGALREGDVLIQMMPAGSGGLGRIMCRGSTYELPCERSEDHPVVPEVNGEMRMVLPEGELQRLLRQSLYSVSEDDSKPQYTGVCLTLSAGATDPESSDPPARLEAAAYDQHRLALAWSRLVEAHGEGEVVIPRAVARALTSILEEKETESNAELLVGRNLASIRVPSRWEIVTRLIDGRFIPYHQYLREGYETRAAVMRDELVSALRRARIVLARSELNSAAPVTISGDGDRVVITGETPLGGRVREELPATVLGDPFTFRVQSGFILDTARILTSPVVALDVFGEQQPIYLRPSGDEPALAMIAVIGERHQHDASTQKKKE